MASNTKKSDNQRRRKTQKLGRARKHKLESKGTTRTEAELFGNVLKA